MKFFKPNLKVCISLILTFVVLCLSNIMYFDWESKISFFINVKENPEISIEYKRSKNSSLRRVDIENAVTGEYTVRLRGRELSYIKINAPFTDITKITKVKYSGLNSKDIILDNNNSAFLNDCYARPHIHDWYNLIVIFVISFYLILFYVNAFVNRNKPKEIDKSPSLMNVEMLRFLFMLSIIFTHTVANFKIWSYGWGAVEFFFILSGFMFTLTFNKERTVADFIRSKFIRFLPLMIFGSLICALFIEHIVWSRMISGFLFVHSTGLGPEHCYLGPAWYLACLFWTLLFYFYLRKITQEQNFNMITGILVFFCYVLWANGDYQGDITKSAINSNDLINQILLSGMVRSIAGVGLGCFVANIYKIIKEKKYIKNWKYNVFEVCLFLYCFGLMFIKQISPDYKIIAVLCFALLILLFSIHKGWLSNLCETSKIYCITKYTFSIYMVHSFFAERLLPNLIANNCVSEHKYIAIILTFMVSIILGIIVHHAIEKPGTKLLKKWLCY